MSGTCVCGNEPTCIGRYEVSVGSFEFGCDTCCGHGNEDGRCVQVDDCAAVLGLVNQVSCMHDDEMFEATAAIAERDALAGQLAEARRECDALKAGKWAGKWEAGIDARILLMRRAPLGMAESCVTKTPRGWYWNAGTEMDWCESEDAAKATADAHLEAVGWWLEGGAFTGEGGK